MELNTLTSECVSLYNALRKPGQEERKRRARFVSVLQRWIDREFGSNNASLLMFGSSSNFMCLRSSDLDISLIHNMEIEDKKILKRVANILRYRGMTNVTVLASNRIRIPLIKFVDPISKLSCDISIDNALGVANSQMIAAYSDIDPRMSQLGLLIKHWASSRQINIAQFGTLSSYGYVLLVIHFLQTRNPPILPKLQQIESDQEHLIVDGYDCYFFSKIDTLKNFGKRNKESIGDLFSQFMEFYAVQFNWKESVVCPRIGGILTKAEKNWTKFDFALEDPFEIDRNLGCVMDKNGYDLLQYEFKRARKLLQQNAPLDKICIPFSEKEPIISFK